MEKCKAIILRSTPWSETSSIVSLLTNTAGRFSALARGARRLRSPFESALDLLSVSDVVFIAKSADVLRLLTEAKLERRFKSGQRALLPLYCGYYVAELLTILLEDHQYIPGLFELVDRTLQDLDQGRCTASTVLRFELHLLRQLGHAPSMEVCVGCGDEVVSSTRDVAFGVHAGGVLCVRCTPGNRMVIRIRNHIRQTLQRFANEEATELDMERDQRGEIRFIMDRVVSHLADRRPRLMDCLEELKR